jgi:hypothetical protein
VIKTCYNNEQKERLCLIIDKCRRQKLCKRAQKISAAAPLRVIKYLCLTLFFDLFFFLFPYWQKYCSFIPAGFFWPSYWQTSGNFVQAYFWYFCQYGNRKKNKSKNKVKHKYFRHYIIESESTTRFKNRSSDRMMTSDWLVDVSDDRYTTNGSI